MNRLATIERKSRDAALSSALERPGPSIELVVAGCIEAAIDVGIAESRSFSL